MANWLEANLKELFGRFLLERKQPERNLSAASVRMYQALA
jgi:hypothetical protein